MGSFKQMHKEGLVNLEKTSGEAMDLGQEMTKDAEEINSILESINLQDDEDISAINETSSSYQGSFDNAFGEQVEPMNQEVARKGSEIQNSVNQELGNVRSGISSLERARGISEIGRDAAESGRRSLENSQREYEDMNSEAGEIMDETQQKVEELKRNLSGAFRR